MLIIIEELIQSLYSMDKAFGIGSGDSIFRETHKLEKALKPTLKRKLIFLILHDFTLDVS